MADKDFVVKNGLVVNTNLIVANTSSNRIGILTTTPDAPLTVVGAANVQGNAVITGTANITGNSTITGNANVGGNAYFLTNLNVNANVQLSNTQLLIGNSTVNSTVNASSIVIGNSTINSTMNSTSFTGIANNASYLGGVAASNYVNSTGSYTLSGTLTFANSIVIGAAYGISANSSYGQANQLLTSNGTSVYWSTPAPSVNSSAGAGGVQYYNGSVLASNSGFIFTVASNTLSVGNSVNVGNSSGSGFNINVGNSTVNTVINSTSFTGTANNALYLGGVVSTSYVNSTGAYTISGVHTYTAGVILNGPVTIANTLTANSLIGTPGQVLVSGGPGANVYWGAGLNTAAQYFWTNTHNFSNAVTFNGALFSTNTLTANAQVGTAGQILTSGGTGANIYWSNSASANIDGGSGAIQYYNGTTFGSNSGLTFSASSNSLNVSNTVKVTNTVIVGNTTVNGSIASNTTVTYFTGTSYTANNALFLGTVAATNYINTSSNYTITGTHTYSTSGAGITFGAGSLITANGIVGNPGNVLASNGTGLYWTGLGVTSISGGAGLTGTVTSTGSLSVLANNGIVANTTGTFVNANNGLTVNTTGLFVTQGTGTVVNTTGTHVNSAYIATISANNASYLGTVAAANYLTNTGNYQISGIYTHTANIGITGTAVLLANSLPGTGGWLLFSGGASTPPYWAASPYLTGITSSQVTTALGFTPYNATNPSSYITSSALTPYALTTSLASYAPIASPTFTGTVTIPAGASISGYALTTSLASYAPIASPTFTGTVTIPAGASISGYANLSSPSFTGLVRFGKNYAANVISVGAGSSLTINPVDGNYFVITGSGAVTVGFGAAPASGNLYSMVVKTSGVTSITWSVAPKWPGAIAPSPSTNTDIWVFFTDDGGTTWRGNQVQRDSR